MKNSYEHTQMGYLTTIAIGAALLNIVYFVIFKDLNWIAWIVILVLGMALLLFATLKVTISDDWLEIRLGIGIIQKRIPLQDIQSAQVVKYPWYYGWGVRVTLQGEWIYSVSGFRAVKIETRTGDKYIIGIDVADEFAAAVQKAIEYN